MYHLVPNQNILSNIRPQLGGQTWGREAGRSPGRSAVRGRPFRASVPGSSVPGRGRGRLVFLCPFPLLPGWLSPTPNPPTPDPHPRSATRKRWPLQGILKFKRAGPQLPHASTPPPPLRRILPHVLLPELGLQKGAPPTWAQQSQTTCRAAVPSRN